MYFHCAIFGPEFEQPKSVLISGLFYKASITSLRALLSGTKVYKSSRVDTIFIGKISKGHNSIKNVGRVTVLYLCTSSDGGLYLYKVS